MTNRRDFLKTGTIATVVGTTLLTSFVETAEAKILGDDEPNIIDNNGKFILPKLPYAYADMEPNIDAETMELHHTKHHQAYVDGLNKAETELAKARDTNDFVLVKHWSKEAAFHGAGHFLHTLFWFGLAPTKSAKQSPSGSLLKDIEKDFGSFDKFKSHFIAASTAVESNGWGILAYQPFGKKMVVLQAEKHQNLSQMQAIPLLCIDVWEHAYYLKYRNKRKDYVTNFFNIINWDTIARRLDKAKKF